MALFGGRRFDRDARHQWFDHRQHRHQRNSIDGARRLCVLAIWFRIQNPLGVAPDGWYHSTGSSIVLPHNLSGLLFQSTIAILILVGFESSTALAAEAKNHKRDIPRGVILSIVIQGLLAYLFEYFAANSMRSPNASGRCLNCWQRE